MTTLNQLQRGALYSQLTVFLFLPWYASAQTAVNQILSFTTASVSLFDNHFKFQEEVPASQIGVPVDVLKVDDRGFVQIQLDDGAKYWIDETEVELRHGGDVQTACAPRIVAGQHHTSLAPMGAGGRCKK